jgi:hypothetical protein
MKKWIALFDLICLGLVLALIGGGRHAQPRAPGAEARPAPPLVVLAEPDDPYAALADEIARAENAPRLYAIAELEGVDAAQVIYVASPGWLTERKLLDLSALSVSTGRYPAVGIISGSTMEQARALWLRAADVRPGSGVAASATSPSQAIKETLIWHMSPAPVTTQPLTQDHLLHALQEAGYFYWARHVATTNWFWYEGEYPVEEQRLTAGEVPALPPVVVHTPSCRSFVPWAEDSIALAFVDRGAAAYLGHLYSPISSDYDIGHLRTLPGYDTWPGVSMGVLAQVQNRATERACATRPFMYMLGDPRVALQASAPYTITADVQQGNRRVLRGDWESAGPMPGVLPLRIPDGAAYRFVQVKGVGAIAESDSFYHGRIQTLNVQEDKVALIVHPGGPFEVVLRRAAPPLWHQADALRDAFEYVWCDIAPMQAPLALLPLALLLLVGAVKRLRKKPLRPYLPALAVGAGWAIVQLAFCLLRVGRVSVTSYEMRPTPLKLGLAFVGTSGFGALGLVCMLSASRHASARRLVGRILGLGLCLAPTAALLVFYAAMVTVINLSMAQRAAGVWSLNYAPVRMATIVGLVEAAVFVHGYRLLRKRQ